jgi:hypothetical protein
VICNEGGVREGVKVMQTMEEIYERKWSNLTRQRS